MSQSMPPAVYAADTPLRDLGTAELLLTVTMRLFAANWSAQGGSRPDWRGGLVRCGAGDEAMAAFDGVFSVVLAASRRPLDLRCATCPTLSPDEGRLLQIVSLFQHQRPDDAVRVLGRWLTPAAQRLGAAPAEALGRALTRVGLVVPWRHAEAAASSARAGSRGLMLVH